MNDHHDPDPTLEPPPPARPERPAVRTYELTRTFGRLRAVDSVTLDIPRGAIFGLIGPNGAGKTTTLAMLATLLLPTSGHVEVAGFDPVTEQREVRRRLGYMPDVMGVVGDLRVDEYLRFFAAAYQVPSSEHDALVEGLLELVDLSVKREATVDSLSRGMKQRLGLARALVHDPEVLLLDEPASGLDPRARIELRGLLSELRSLGKTILISSHILAELEDMCTDVAIMEAGRLLASGTPDEIRSRFTQTRVVRVRLAGGEETEYEVADDAEQQELLRRLVVEEGLPVLEFKVGRVLEDVFMQVTTGELQ
ncbi:MAG TPA: ABC transporter ATP-binding protein [Actinomycetota bacterium]|nr:ABC transporter ATP-binding protein [Actinomycetota bacterium]